VTPKTKDGCRQMGTGEAERYQGMLTERKSGIERLKYMAKRDASTRIARLIRLGTCECLELAPESERPAIVTVRPLTHERSE
jgi:hypothetical protein